MRIGGNILKSHANPDEWIQLVKDLDYSCVLAPVSVDEATKENIKEYKGYAKKHDLVIGEVGIWRNTMSTIDEERKKAVADCIKGLALAEEFEANCCVNVVGGSGEKLLGLYAENYSKDTYELVVDTVRRIIDDVKPKHTFYTIECMPYQVPDSVNQYLQLIKDVNRKAFGVHLDFVNLINTPKKFVFHQKLIRQAFKKLGSHVKSVHLKDVRSSDEMPIEMIECMPGQGVIDFTQVLPLCEALGKNMPVFIEHLSSYDDYKRTIVHVRNIGKQAKVHIL